MNRVGVPEGGVGIGEYLHNSEVSSFSIPMMSDDHEIRSAQHTPNPKQMAMVTAESTGRIMASSAQIPSKTSKDTTFKSSAMSSDYLDVDFAREDGSTQTFSIPMMDDNKQISGRLASISVQGGRRVSSTILNPTPIQMLATGNDMLPNGTLKNKQFFIPMLPDADDGKLLTDTRL